jgi:chromosome segregation ATPase
MEVTRSRIAELTAERQPLNDELEFYRKDVNRAPSALRRKLDDNTHSMQVQNEFLAAREEEKRRVNMRFDEERGRLLPYWTPAATSAR